jgi:hypothetical protein
MSNRTGLERMAAQAFPTDDELRAMAPDHERAHGPHRIMREQRLRTAVPGRGPGHRRWGPILAVGVAVTAVLAAVAVFVLPGPVGDPPLTGTADHAPSAPALTGTADQTPPVPAMTVEPASTLDELAERAAAQPALADEPYDYVHVRRIRPDVVSSLPDLSDAAVVGESVVDQERWASDDRLERNLESSYDQELDMSYVGGPPRLALPTDPAALEDVLVSNGWSPLRTVSRYYGMENAWSNQVIEPPVQAALLRLLASDPDVRVVGPSTDRLGRPGLAVAVTETGEFRGHEPGKEHAVIEHTMIFDQRTGALLAHENVLVEGGENAGPRPLSLGHEMVVTATRVGSTTDRPG